MRDEAERFESPVGLRDIFLHGREPPPLAAVTRLECYPWLVVGTVCVGAFMGQLDASIAQLVLPELETAFAQRLSIVSWVSIAYLLTLTAFLPIVGRLADLEGRKLLYTGGFVIFIIGSGLCGAAHSLAFLIACRGVQAIGAALLQANSVAIVVTAAGERRRGRAIGIQAMAQAVGLSAGPALGGLLIAALGWRWVFWINVPFGIAGATLGWLLLPKTAHRARRRRFDWWGALTLAPTLTASFMMLQEFQDRGIDSTGFMIAAAAAALMLPLFIWSEQTRRDPLLHLALFRIPAFWAGNVAGLCSYAILFGLFLLMPFVFERGYDEGPLLAGLQLTIVPVALGLVAMVSGFVYDRIGPRVPTVGGMALTVAACGLMVLSLNGNARDLLPLMASLALFGIGEGLFTAPNNSAIIGAAPANRTGEAGGILNTMRSFGTSFGVAAASTVLTWRIGAAVGTPASTLGATTHRVLAAAHDVVIVFALLAVIAGLLSFMRQGDIAPGPHDPVAVSG